MTTTSAPSENPSRTPEGNPPALAPKAGRCRRRWRQRSGFSLVEAMVATAIGSAVIAATMVSVLAIARSSMSVGNYAEMNLQSRIGLENVGREVRSAHDIMSVTPTSFTISVPRGSGNPPEVLSFRYDQSRGVITRTGRDNVPRVIFEDIDALRFRYYNLRNEETTNPLEIKSVQIDARMVRKLSHLKNTNHLISASFMMRNRLVSN